MSKQMVWSKEKEFLSYYPKNGEECQVSIVNGDFEWCVYHGKAKEIEERAIVEMKSKRVTGRSSISLYDFDLLAFRQPLTEKQITIQKCVNLMSNHVRSFDELSCSDREFLVYLYDLGLLNP